MGKCVAALVWISFSMWIRDEHFVCNKAIPGIWKHFEFPIKVFIVSNLLRGKDWISLVPLCVHRFLHPTFDSSWILLYNFFTEVVLSHCSQRHFSARGSMDLQKEKRPPSENTENTEKFPHSWKKIGANFTVICFTNLLLLRHSIFCSALRCADV